MPAGTGRKGLGPAGQRQWSEGITDGVLEKKPEEIWPDWYLRDFAFDREKLLPITEELANLWEVTFYHRELRDGAAEMLQALKSRGYHLGVISKQRLAVQCVPRAGGLRHPRLYGGCNGLQRHRLSQTPSGDLPDRPAANAGKAGNVRLCGRHGLQGHHRPQAGGLLPRPCRSAPSCRSRRMCTWPRMGTAGQGYRNTDGPGDLAGPDQSRAGPRPRRITSHLICSLYFFLFLERRHRLNGRGASPCCHAKSGGCQENWASYRTR